MTTRLPGRWWQAALFTLGLVSLRLWIQMASRPSPPAGPLAAGAVSAPPCCSPSGRACWAGWNYRTRAKLAAIRQLEALEEWDPDAMKGLASELCRRQMLACDRDGDLRRARRAAQQAAALARNPAEAYRATLLLAYLAGDTGDHRAELKLARKMMALRPHSPSSLAALWHAARFNGMEPLACQAMVALRRWREAPESAAGIARPVAGIGDREGPAASPVSR